MSLAFRKNSRAAWGWLCAVSVLGTAMAMPVLAQYPGHVDTAKSGPPPLRATAIYEWTGSLQKPDASRLVPIAIFDGENYQPGGLYLAQPAPLAVQPGTVYELEKAGTPKGLVDIDSAARLGSEWIGLGKWRPEVAPPTPKLLASKNPPTVVGGSDSDRPHYGKEPHEKKSGSAAPKPASSPPPVDPERPTLRRRPAQSAAKAASSAPEMPVTATTSIDPNRPRLSYGVPASEEKITEPAKLQGTPADLKQMVAISDTRVGEPHSFAYRWADPADATKMKSAMEVLAGKVVAAQLSSPIDAPKKKTARRVRSRRRKAPVKPPLPTLTDEDFKAYELSYSGGATLVFTAKTESADDPKYVTLIAQPDFYGTPRVLFKQVTSGNMLDITPRMNLIDAVDTDDDNRAELIFELHGKTQHQFAIYRVAGGTAEQVFVTDWLP